jgi:prepilin-type processing-associated H-X9-DG protein
LSGQPGIVSLILTPTRQPSMATSTTIPINTYTPVDGSCAAVGNFSVSNWGVSIGFKSRHTPGANFAFGDGSVRFVNENLNMNVFQLLGHHADGQVSGVDN